MKMVGIKHGNKPASKELINLFDAYYMLDILYSNQGKLVEAEVMYMWAL